MKVLGLPQDMDYRYEFINEDSIQIKQSKTGMKPVLFNIN